MKPLNLTCDVKSSNLRQLLVLFVITICIVLSRKTTPAAELSDFNDGTNQAPLVFINTSFENACNPLVEELRSQIAFMRGPLLYCLESLDLPDRVNIMDVLLPRNIALRPRFDKNLLGSVTVLEGKALYIKDKDWSGQPYGAGPLYKEIGDSNPQPFLLRLIPYYAWSNRGVSQMTVWLPVD